MGGLDFNALELSVAALTMGMKGRVREGEKGPREKLQTRGEATAVSSRQSMIFFNIQNRYHRQSCRRDGQKLWQSS